MIELIVLKRILLALVLGAIIGYEREKAHKVAGLRTHMMVCISSALITLVALYGFDEGTADTSSRIISNILIGIGFIGGGAILKQENHVQGTTTAATLWTVSAVGIAVGIGFTYAAILVTLIAYIILTILWRFEVKINSNNHADPNETT